MSDDFGLPSTSLSLLEEAVSKDAQVRKRAVQKLLESYLPGMRRYVAWRVSHPRVNPEDIVHNLLAGKVLQQQLLERYLASDRKGFRSYLKRALYYAAVNEIRRLPRLMSEVETEHAPTGRTPSVEQKRDEDLAEAVVSAEQVRMFLSQVLRQARDYYVGRGRQRDWDAFFRRNVEPIITDTHKPSYDAIARQLGFATGKEASNVVIKVQRRLQSLLDDVLKEKLGTTSPDAIEAELQEIWRCAPLLKSVDIPDVVAQLPADRATDPVDLSSVSGARLSDLFDVAMNRGTELSSVELQAWYHSYAIGALSVIFQRCHLPPPRQLCDTEPEYDPSVESIDRLLRHPNPPLDLLIELKNLSRRAIKSEISTIPTQIALAWLFLSIGLALIRCGQKISKVPEDELRRGFQRILEYSWLDEDSRTLFQEALGRLERAGES
jgi:DNA-directed RNA polymerase specialized sigma24 family protein